MKLAAATACFALAACSGSDRHDPCSGAKPGDACLWAGTGEQGFNGDNPTAHRLDSQLDFPIDLTFASDGRAYIADFNNHRIRRVEKDDSLRVVMGNATEGDDDPALNDLDPICSPPGALGTDVSLNHPSDVKLGPDGMLYVAAWHNYKIRVEDPETLITKVYAGNFEDFSGDGGPACQATLKQPKTMAWGSDGSMYVVDQRNERLRKIAPDGTISTVGGNGLCMYQNAPPDVGCSRGAIGDGGPLAQATFGWDPVPTPRPSGALAISGNTMYIADSGNDRIRKVDLTSGMISCIGNEDAFPGYDGDGGPALAAHFSWPQDLELGPDGRLYIADRYNNAVRAIDLSSGIVTTVVGGSACKSNAQSCPDHGPATSIGLNEPQGVAFDPAGNLYVVDSNNHRILKVIL